VVAAVAVVAAVVLVPSAPPALSSKFVVS